MDISCRHSRKKVSQNHKSIRISQKISPKHRIKDLEYADDVLFVDSYGEIQITLNNVLATAARIGLRVSTNKEHFCLIRS